MKGTAKGTQPHGAVYVQRSNQCSKKKANFESEAFDCGTFTDGAKYRATRPEGEVEYDPAQMHFHAPSEHTINGKTQDLEIHMVMVPAGETAKTWNTAKKSLTTDNTKADYLLNYSVLGVFFNATDCKDSDDVVKCEALLKVTD